MLFAFADVAVCVLSRRAACQQNPFERRNVEAMTKDEETRAGGSAETKGVEDDSQDRKQGDESVNGKDSDEQAADRAGGSAETKGVV